MCCAVQELAAAQAAAQHADDEAERLEAEVEKLGGNYLALEAEVRPGTSNMGWLQQKVAY